MKLTPANIKKLNLVDFSEGMMKYITGLALSYQQAVDRYSVSIDHKIFGSYFVKYDNKEDIIGFAVIKDQGDEAEIGYLVMESYRGMGIATAINQKLIDICHKELSDLIVTAQTDIRNTASIRVLEKSGMSRIGTYEEDGNMICQFTIKA